MPGVLMMLRVCTGRHGASIEVAESAGTEAQPEVCTPVKKGKAEKKPSEVKPSKEKQNKDKAPLIDKSKSESDQQQQQKQQEEQKKEKPQKPPPEFNPLHPKLDEEAERTSAEIRKARQSGKKIEDAPGQTRAASSTLADERVDCRRAARWSSAT